MNIRVITDNRDLAAQGSNFGGPSSKLLDLWKGICVGFFHSVVRVCFFIYIFILINITIILKQIVGSNTSTQKVYQRICPTIN